MFKPILHKDIQLGDIVWIDNYENGKFPKASPKMSGPFVKIEGTRKFQHLKSKRSLTHYPENMVISVFDKIRKHQGFVTNKEIMMELAKESPQQKLLVRCGNGRFITSADNCQHFVDIITKENSDYVRDISIPAGDGFYNEYTLI